MEDDVLFIHGREIDDEYVFFLIIDDGDVGMVEFPFHLLSPKKPTEHKPCCKKQDR